VCGSLLPSFLPLEGGGFKVGVKRFSRWG